MVGAMVSLGVGSDGVAAHGSGGVEAVVGGTVWFGSVGVGANGLVRSASVLGVELVGSVGFGAVRVGTVGPRWNSWFVLDCWCKG